MKKISSGFVVVVVALTVLAGSALAVPAGKTVEFPGGNEGKVVFDGKVHADKGIKCGECHMSPQLFQMKKGADMIRMKNIHTDKYCGACHNGVRAFKAEECKKCHIKQR